LAIDWELHASAMQRIDGREVETIAFLSSLLPDAETDSERATILMGESSCYCALGDFAKTFELLESAKKLAQDDRAILSQVELSEAGARVAHGESELACRQYFSIKSEYHDLLAEDEEFAVELDSRLACALVQVGRNREAIPLFRKVIENPNVEMQWLQLFLGAALANVDEAAEARLHLYAAAKGQNSKWSKSALEHLSAMEGTQ
jgi:tetratricopeptide (TPR) repeat protein